MSLVYLSHPFGGQPENLEAAVNWLAWAHEYTEWGLRVQAPWVASAMAGLLGILSEQDWEQGGGHDIERQTLKGYSAILLVGRSITALSRGQRREAEWAYCTGYPVYHVQAPLRDARPTDIVKLVGVGAGRGMVFGIENPPDGPVRPEDCECQYDYRACIAHEQEGEET